MRRCSVCSHSAKNDIDVEIITGQLSIHEIASKYDICFSSVQRHSKSHLPLMLAHSNEVQTSGFASNTLKKLADIEKELWILKDNAYKKGQLNIILGCCRELRESNEFFLKLMILAKEKKGENPSLMVASSTVMRELSKTYPKAFEFLIYRLRDVYEGEQIDQDGSKPQELEELFES